MDQLVVATWQKPERCDDMDATSKVSVRSRLARARTTLDTDDMVMNMFGGFFVDASILA